MEIKSFVLPAGVEFSEDEKKGLNALGDYIKGQFEEMVAGIKSQNEIVEAVKEEFGKLGLSPEKIEKLEGALKAQGVEIATMKKGTPKQEGHKTLVAAMEEVLKSEEFAAAYKDMRNGRGETLDGRVRAQTRHVGRDERRPQPHRADDEDLRRRQPPQCVRATLHAHQCARRQEPHHVQRCFLHRRHRVCRGDDKAHQYRHRHAYGQIP